MKYNANYRLDRRYSQIYERCFDRMWKVWGVAGASLNTISDILLIGQSRELAFETEILAIKQFPLSPLAGEGQG